MCFYCSGREFDPWSGNKDPVCLMVWQINKEIKNFKLFIRLKQQQQMSSIERGQGPAGKWAACRPLRVGLHPAHGSRGADRAVILQVLRTETGLG